MTAPDPLLQLKELLANSLIGKRKAGITRAAQLLADDQHILQVRALLEGVAKNDAIGIVREAARAVLDADEKRRNPPPPDYVFGAKCPHCHHISYLDKREVCPKLTNLDREVKLRDGVELDTITVTCKHCGKEFKTGVPCKGYK